MSYRLPTILIVLTLMCSLQVFAHAPVVELNDSNVASPIEIVWPLDISIAIYGWFESHSDVDVVTFQLGDIEASKQVPLFLHTLVPACKSYQTLLPSVAVVGPRQSHLVSPSIEEKIPFSIEEKAGVKILDNSQQGQTWFEPFSRKNYYWQNSMTVKLDKPGKYQLYVWSPTKVMGDYVLAIGTREKWGMREISRALRHMPRLLADYEIHNESCRTDLRQQKPSKNPLPQKND